MARTTTKEKKGPDPQIVVLKNVRGSFLHVFSPQEKEQDDGTMRRTYNGNFMMEKGTDDTKRNLAAIKKAAHAARTSKWGDNEKKWPKIPSHKMCLRDGDNPDHTDRDEYEDHYFLSAATPEDKPCRVLTNRKDTDDKWIEATPGQKGAPYSGCYCNVIVRVWAQDNKHGKRINAALQTVQFRADGEPFAAQNADADDLLSEDDVSYEGDLDDDDIDTGDEEEDLI